MNRREFITLLGSAATWLLAARAQQPAMPIVGFVTGRSAEASVRQAAAFCQGLNETGYVEGRDVMVEYHWLEGQYDRLPALMADLVRRRVAVITAFANLPALAAKAATTTIPIVFGVGQDPVRMGLVASLARPGGNASGINFFNQEAVAKRLGLLVPKAVRIAVLVNPANASASESTLREIPEAARAHAWRSAVVVMQKPMPDTGGSRSESAPKHPLPTARPFSGCLELRSYACPWRSARAIQSGPRDCRRHSGCEVRSVGKSKPPHPCRRAC
jgi:ABC-type uncharacterized transport system substrate-binding protein